ncbi:MAG: peptidoglycan/xylan/chitin deacetylase (PgdA/CDA1 family) [Planctomycetota bacterium]|jgi:peptidoglycan/xylan/chitin deacetylase (PgdA/CDA1 family)
MAPRLVVVIDTEEDWFDEWDRPTTIDNVFALPEIQKQYFDPVQVKPTYTITYPVATNAECVSIFKRFAEEDVAEIGTHVHNWTSPPFTEHDRIERTYHSSIDPVLERQKIAELTGIIEKEVGSRPTTFKGGRWGASGNTIKSLFDLGYTVDTSVCPITDFRPFQGGPDYTDAPFDCYFPSHGNIMDPDVNADRTSSVLEVPVSVGFANSNFESQLRTWKKANRNVALKSLKAVGILNRLGVVCRIKLTPEQSNLAEMKQLVDALLRREHQVINLTFHSCILSLGHSPYSMTQVDLDERLARIAGILDYIVNEKGIAPATCRELRAGFEAGTD